MFNLTIDERRQLSRGDGNLSKELRLKKKLFSIIKEESKLRRCFDDLLVSSFDEDGDKEEKSSGVTQRMEQALVERRRYFSTNPPTMTKALSLPSILNSSLLPRKTQSKTNDNTASVLNNNTILNDRFPSLQKQNEGSSKDERCHSVMDGHRRKSSDEMVGRRSRALSCPAPPGIRRPSRSIKDVWRNTVANTWKFKLHRRRYALFS